MKTPFDSPALYLQSELYPLAWEGKVPKRVLMVKKAIRLPLEIGTVRVSQPIALMGTLFDAWVNWNGTVWVLFERGENLMLLSEEFQVVEWHTYHLIEGEQR